MADYWLSSWPGSEAAILLALCNILLQENLFDRSSCANGSIGKSTSEASAIKPQTFQSFIAILKATYARYTPEFAAKEAGVDPHGSCEVAHEIAARGSAFSAHVWRNAAAGNLGGWQVARALHFLACWPARWERPGGTAPTRPTNTFRRRP